MSMNNQDGKAVPTAAQLQAQAAFMQQSQMSQQQQWPQQQAYATGPFVAQPGATFDNLLQARNQSILHEQMRQNLLQQQQGQQESAATENMRLVLQQKEVEEQISRLKLQNSVMQTASLQASEAAAAKTNKQKKKKPQAYPPYAPQQYGYPQQHGFPQYGYPQHMQQTYPHIMHGYNAAPGPPPATVPVHVAGVVMDATALQQAAVSNVEKVVSEENSDAAKPPSNLAANLPSSENPPPAVLNLAAASSATSQSSTRVDSPNTTGEVTTSEPTEKSTATQPEAETQLETATSTKSTVSAAKVAQPQAAVTPPAPETVFEESNKHVAPAVSSVNDAPSETDSNLKEAAVSKDATTPTEIVPLPVTILEERSFSPDTQAEPETQAEDDDAVSTTTGGDPSIPQSVTTVSVKPVVVTTQPMPKPAVEASVSPAAAVEDKQVAVTAATLPKPQAVVDLSVSPTPVNEKQSPATTTPTRKPQSVVDLSVSPASVKEKQVTAKPQTVPELSIPLTAVNQKQAATATTPKPQVVSEPPIVPTRTPRKSALSATKKIGLQMSSGKRALDKIAQAEKEEAAKLLQEVIQKALDVKKQEQAAATLKASTHPLKVFPVATQIQQQAPSAYRNTMSPSNVFAPANGGNVGTASTGSSRPTTSNLARAQIAPHVELQSRKRKPVAGPQQARVSPEVEFVQVTRPAPRQANAPNFMAVPQALPPTLLPQMVPTGNTAARLPTTNTNVAYSNNMFTHIGSQYEYQQAQQYLQLQHQQRRQLREQAIQAAMAQTQNSRVEYDVATLFVPLGGPQSGQAPGLLRSFYQLSSSNGCAFQASGLYSLRPQQAVNAPRQTNLSKAMSTAYQNYMHVVSRNNGTVPRNQTVVALACLACIKDAAGQGFSSAGSVYFPHDAATLASCFLAIKAHMQHCPNCQLSLRNVVSGITTLHGYRGSLREFTYIKQFCRTYGMFQSTVNRPARPKPLIDVTDVYDDNVNAIEDALKTTTMSLRGVVGQDVCDIVDSDLVRDDPFCLFAFEHMSLVRIYKKFCLPEHRELFDDESISDNEVFFLQCRCCGGRTKDGAFNPDATALLVESKQCAVKVSNMIFKHFETCLAGKQLQKFELLKLSPVAENKKFVIFGISLHRRIVSIILWISELYKDSLRIAALPDQELWRSVHGEQIRTWFNSDDGIPVSDLMGPKKAAGAPGSAVLECWGFPKLGLLDGAVDTPTRSDLKMSCPNKRARLEKVRFEAERPQAERPGSKVMDVEVLPNVELAKAHRYLQSGVVHVDNL